MTATPRYHGLFEPVYPCREIHTRHCPVVYDAVCGGRPCARYEADDGEVRAAWLAELPADLRDRGVR